MCKMHLETGDPSIHCELLQVWKLPAGAPLASSWPIAYSLAPAHPQSSLLQGGVQAEQDTVGAVVFR